MVSNASVSARSRGSPASTPASAIASATRNTYAGPEPDRPVTASSADSLTRTTAPTPNRISSAHWRSCSSAADPGAIAVDARADQRRRVRHRAHDGQGRADRGLDRPRGDPRRHREDPPAPRLDRGLCGAATSTGLTARTAPAAATGASATVTPGYLSVSSSRRASTTSDTAKSSAGRPSASNPPSSASPMRPPPTISKSGIDSQAYPRVQAAGLTRAGRLLGANVARA